MKYTLPNSYKNAGLQVDIPETILRQYRLDLGSTKAAIDKWLYENGYIVKAEYETVVEKTAVNRKSVQREFKIDEEKAKIISYIDNILRNTSVTELGEAISDLEITNPNRMIAFSFGDNKYELTLVKKKQPK